MWDTQLVLQDCSGLEAVYLVTRSISIGSEEVKGSEL